MWYIPCIGRKWTRISKDFFADQLRRLAESRLRPPDGGTVRIEILPLREIGQPATHLPRRPLELLRPDILRPNLLLDARAVGRDRFIDLLRRLVALPRGEASLALFSRGGMPSSRPLNCLGQSVQKVVEVTLEAAKRHAVRRETARRRCVLRDDGAEVQTLEELVGLPRRQRQALHPDAFVPRDLLDAPEVLVDLASKLRQPLGRDRPGQLLPDLLRKFHQPGDTESSHEIHCYRLRDVLSISCECNC